MFQEITNSQESCPPLVPVRLQWPETCPVAQPSRPPLPKESSQASPRSGRLIREHVSIEMPEMYTVSMNDACGAYA